MNKVFLIGRLTKDPTTQPKKDGKVNYTKFSIAVNRFPENVDYFDCVAFDKTGEAILAYTKMGVKIAISGRIQMDKYTTKDGTTRVQAHIVCENVEFLSPKDEKPTEKPAETSTKEYDDLPF